MEVKRSNPRAIAKQIMRDSILEALRVENEAFKAAVLQEIKNYPFSRNRAIAALNSGAFDKVTLRDIHLDFCYSGVRGFTDAILMAFHTRQLENRLGTKGKMASRFLLTEGGAQPIKRAPGRVANPPQVSLVISTSVLCTIDKEHLYTSSPSLYKGVELISTSSMNLVSFQAAVKTITI